ncbi:SCAN domain-containing protein 3 [Trichonephila clavipes]|nr:SCAN domain-containing protein 3 [Trichonephila clavipes]
MNNLSTVIKNIKEFADRFVQFKTNKTTLAFIVHPLNKNNNEIYIGPFGIDTESLEMQLIDLKNETLWSGKFRVEKQVRRVGGPGYCMCVMQQK